MEYEAERLILTGAIAELVGFLFIVIVVLGLMAALYMVCHLIGLMYGLLKQQHAVMVTVIRSIASYFKR